MYTAEGFLYREMNKLLREENILYFKKLKYYYTALLASFQYYAKDSLNKIMKEKFEIDEKGDIFIYRASNLSLDEIEHYKENPNTIRIFNEFLSTTLDINVVKKFQPICLYKIKIRKDFINKDFAFLDDELTIYKNEKEVLLRSGSILYFDDFKHISDQNLPRFILSGKIIKFEEILNLNIHKIDLSGNDFGDNIEKFRKLINTFIHKNIQDIRLGGSKIGESFEKIKCLEQLLKTNKYIKKIDLSRNDFGYNPENFKYLIDVIKINKTINQIDLTCNNLGKIFYNVEILFELLEQNIYITDIFLSGNNISKNNILFLSKIRKFNLKYDYDIKYDIITLGDDFCGKSTFIQTFKHNNFQGNQLTTIGIYNKSLFMNIF